LEVISNCDEDEVVSGKWILRCLENYPEGLTEKDILMARYASLQTMWHVAVEATKVIMEEKSVVDVPKPAIVLGDIRGQWSQLHRWLRVQTDPEYFNRSPRVPDENYMKLGGLEQCLQGTMLVKARRV
jgi:hypothetical protein